MINKRQRGSEYEELAAKYLISKGYRILERNYSDRAGEIDIIASKDGMLIFCEVKYRGGTGYGSALEAARQCTIMHIMAARRGYSADLMLLRLTVMRLNILRMHLNMCEIGMETGYE